MPTLAFRAVKNNKNLTGPELSFREAIAAWCENTYRPFTDKNQTFLGEFVGQEKAQRSKSLAGLREKGEVAEDDGKIYLLRLDDYQLNEIARRDYALLKKLAVLGSADAALMVIGLTKNLELLKEIEAKYSYSCISDSQSKEIVKKVSKKVVYLETKVVSEETCNSFLMQFFLFSSFQIDNKSFQIDNSQTQEVSYLETKVVYLETPYKEANEIKENIGEIKLEEEEEETASSSKVSSVKNFRARANSVEAGQRNAKVTHDAQSGDESNGKKEIDKNELRHDIPVSEGKKWLAWLGSLPKYQGINIPKLYERMKANCAKNGSTPSRTKFLRWLLDEVGDVPIVVENETSNTVEKSAMEDDAGELKLLSAAERERDLAELRELAQVPDAIAAFEKYYLPADWKWLKENLEN